MDVIGNWLLGFGTNLFDSILSIALSFFVSVTEISTAVLNITIVKNAITYAQTLATALLVIKLMADLYKGHIAALTGERADVPSGAVVARGVFALFTIWLIPYMANQLILLGNYVTQDIASISGNEPLPKTVTETLRQAFLSVANTGTTQAIMAFCGSIFVLVVGICLVIIVFQMAKRSVEVAVMVIIGPIFTINMASEDKSLFNSWTRHLILICLSQALQILLLRILFYVVTHMASMAFTFAAMSILIVLALLAFTLKTPKFLQQFAYYQSGGGGAGAVSHFASSAISLIGKK